MKLSFWKILGFFSAVAEWATEALKPDEDGKVRVTIVEATDLVSRMCEVFGWQAEIVVDEVEDES